MIQLKNVSKYYYSKGMIASGISKVNLNLDIGEFVVITGESGSGKSTLLNVISGLDSYEEGEMYIDGQETSHYLAADFEEYRKKYIGNIFQNYNLVNSYTVYQNVEMILRINGYSRDEMRKRANQIIKRVGLASHSKMKVSKLSGGQKQRVSIARALAKDTDVIVADEPTGNLDSESTRGIVELLREISREKLVIVVTHNFPEFENYATRVIKMHDGKIVEDRDFREQHLIDNNELEEARKNRKYEVGSMSAGSKVRLGLRNTFNIIPKFILLLVVFLFVVLAVTGEYTSVKNADDVGEQMGYNSYFYNYSRERMVLEKKDKSPFTADDYRVLSSVSNVKTVVPNDTMLDASVYGEMEGLYIEGHPKSSLEMTEKLARGRMPEASNEVVVTFFEGDASNSDEILGREVNITSDSGKEHKVVIVGTADVKIPEDAMQAMYVSNYVYMQDELLSVLIREQYENCSDVEVEVNGKRQQFATIKSNDKVSQGEALMAEETNNFFEKGNAKGKNVVLEVKNIHYEQPITLKISDLYTKKTFVKKTGEDDYETNNGNIYINPADYTALYKTINYQCTVYVDNEDNTDAVTAALEPMGYTVLSLKDAIMSFGFGEMMSIVQVPVAVVIVCFVFFIAYFVTRLILRSRTGYFSILRMLGLDKTSIRRILDIELFTVFNIAFLIFLALVFATQQSIITVQYLQTLVDFLKETDYVILYLILFVMSYLISGKFAKSLFKKTAIGGYREEA